MNHYRCIPYLRAAALVGLAIAAAACTRQMSQDPARAGAPTAEVPGGSAWRHPADGQTVAGRRDVYIGDTFADVQRSLGSKPQDAEAPSF